MEDLEIEKWTHCRKKLLIQTRLRNESGFLDKRKKRTVLWEKVLREIREVDPSFSFSRDEISRKFLNFMITYKRIKRRSTSGEAVTSWEFFEDLDEVFGSRSDIYVSENKLDASAVCALSEDSENTEFEFVSSSPEPKAKRLKCETLTFLKEESKKDDETVNKLIALEEIKLEFEKEKLEKEDLESEKWTHCRKKLLIQTRLRNESGFLDKRKKRTVLWEKVLREIREVDPSFPFSRDDISGKFLNFVVTYKRIKRRSTSGEAVTSWEFFEDLDEVFGSRSDIYASENMLDASAVCALSEDSENSEFEFVSSSPKSKANRPKCETLTFFKEESKKDDESVNKLIALEEIKLEFEKEKLEKEDLDSEKWTHCRKKLLIQTRLRNESGFLAKRRKRTALWEKVLREIREVDPSFPFSREEISRKFLNFMMTYKRIKRRSTSGEAVTSWEFFEDFNEVFGSRSDIYVSENMLDESLVCALSEDSESTEFEFVSSSPEPKAKRLKCEILTFLKEESKKDDEFLNKLIALEEKKLELEKEKVAEIRNLRIALAAALNNAEK